MSYKVTDRKLSEIKKITHEPNKKLSGEIEATERNQIEILELKHTVNEVKNAMSINCKIDQAEEGIC